MAPTRYPRWPHHLRNRRPKGVAELPGRRGRSHDRGPRKGRLMPLVRLLLNILWIITGGLWMAALWLLAAIIMVITIVGIPWARAGFNIAVYTLLPFGQEAVSRAGIHHFV